MLKQISIILWTTDRSGNYFEFNEAWHEYTAMSPTISKEEWLTSVYTDDRALLAKEFLRAVQRHQSFSVRFRLRHKTGQYNWFVMSGQPILNDANEMQGMNGSLVNLHGPLVSDDNQKFRDLIIDAPVGMTIFTDPHFKVEVANSTYLEIIDR